MNKQSDLLPILAGVFMASIFGFSFFFTAQALDEIGTMQLLGYRFALAAIALTVLQIFGLIKINFKGKSLGKLMVLALFQPVIYFVFETIGVKMTSASESGMIIATIPVVVTFMSIIFLKERPSIMQIGSILLSVSGVTFIVAMTSSGGNHGNLLGLIILFGAVLAAGVYNILSRSLSLAFNPVEITFVMMWFGAIIFNGISVYLHLSRGELGQYLAPFSDLKVVSSLLYLGLISSVAAFFLLNFMLSRMEAARSAVFANLTTIVAILAGVIFRGEPFYWFHAVGGVLILLGVYGTNYFSAKKRAQVVA